MARKQTFHHFKSGKTYGIALAAVLAVSLLTWLIHPAPLQGDDSLVFLRTTLTLGQTVVDHAVQAVSDELTVEFEQPETVDPDQALIAMLMQDDASIVYDTLDDQDSWHVVRMRVTGYCACPKCCGKFSDGKTASNHTICYGDVFVAADKRYRFGTQMIIPGYNGGRSVTVQDRGRVIKGDRLDVYFDSHRQAQKWGVKYLNVMVRNR